MDEYRMERRNQKKSKVKKRILYTVLLIIVIFLGIGVYLFTHGYNAVQNSYEDLDRKDNKSDLREEAITIGDDPLSILLIGVEDYSTGGENGRADTQIVVTLNPKTNKMTMTSVPRDTRVELTAEEATDAYAGSHKINAAYTFGSISGYGANKLTVEKVEDLLGIPIDEYITVNFDGFREIVDALGGVTIDIKEGFWEENIYDNNNRITFESGPAKLNGEEALAFVRMRKRDVNTVYPRDERQRQFIQATIDQAISAGTIFKVGEISNIIGANVTTSLTASEIFALQKMYSSMDASSIETIEIEGSDQRVDGIWYFIPAENGIENASLQLKENLGLDKPNAEQNTDESTITE
ncbi:LCP family protein [Aquibacillus koreensis]|uniref:LCP family protein n=1 Tax=Aquibacillus koreensis TaxID=279446 RepID=A0A9X3WJ72_9BACI|nr:LCP family protein [Aquibacillus koreensis]MCT2534203.1 LCP family protein [Aquibacillus koreensis]MDC3420752.1 LCP family protein [Aquibacillus koreensis]